MNSAGGLVTAVAPVVIDCKGLWIGWSGLHDLGKDEKIPEANPDDLAPTAGLLSEQVILILYLPTYKDILNVEYTKKFKVGNNTSTIVKL